MTEFFQNLGMSYNAAWLTATIAGILLIALPLMLSVAMIIYADRKIWAAMALRRGPNVVGPFGLLQSFADGLKVFLQETIIPSASNRGLFLIAPIITFTVALMAWAVIPFNSGAVLADINVGLLYILAISSLRGNADVIAFDLILNDDARLPRRVLVPQHPVLRHRHDVRLAVRVHIGQRDRITRHLRDLGVEVLRLELDLSSGERGGEQQQAEE